MRAIRVAPRLHRGLATAAAGLTFTPVEDPKSLDTAISSALRETETRQGLLSLPPCHKRPISLAARTRDGTVAGGLYGYTNWNELHLSLFAANPACRVRGMGKTLMQHVEQAARSQYGCNRLGLETFSWQARPFYESIGFSLFGTLRDQPRGHEKFFMEKVWPVESKLGISAGPKGAAAELAIGDWNGEEAEAQLLEWLDGDTQGRNVPGVPLCDLTTFSLKATNASGADVAYCVYATWWNELHVVKLVVVPDMQRRGLGTAVLRQMEEIARGKGLGLLVADTMGWQAKGFYERHGFEVFATQKDLPQGYDRHRFARAVSP